MPSSAAFATEVYASGAEFPYSIDNHAPECLVLDLHMPEFSGFDVQHHLQRSHPDVRVVVITGHDTAEARNRALTFGAKAYLSKPVDGGAFLVAINGGLQL